MIGENEDREIVDWHRDVVDGTTVYEIEYSDPVPELQGGPPEPTSFGAGSGGTVPIDDQEIQLPGGERIAAREATFESEGTTLRVRCEKPSLLSRVRRLLPW
ncbi:hypothetical protein [Haloterrigena alkaliphila]|uniref:Uncharacterized protein n=1 Tax=Haloterrigena alkaliphila TaxID=2816475 RepID=A0A8A2V949_9EURY|nr:hypothetical protein [Haloterrigena alkaliphila]QSW98539.1 hypothetical protein J0X25_14220 [Haloterrigena alkaliphila]